MRIHQWLKTSKLCLSPFRLTVVIIVLLTAIPASLRSPVQKPVDWGLEPGDFFVNVLLYLPFGIFHPKSSLAIVAIRATAISAVVEVLQLFAAYRYPGPVDVVANTIGAVIGYVIIRSLGFDLSLVRLRRAAGVIGFLLLASWLVYMWLVIPIHPLPNELSEASQVSGYAFLIALGSLGVLQRQDLELRLFTAGLTGFLTGRILLGILYYPSLGYLAPLIGCTGGLLATWVTERYVVSRFR